MFETERHNMHTVAIYAAAGDIQGYFAHRIQLISESLEAAEILTGSGFAEHAKSLENSANEKIHELHTEALANATQCAACTYRASDEFLSAVKVIAGEFSARYWEGHGQIRLYVRDGSKADYVQIRGFQGYSAQASIRRHDVRRPRRVEEIRNAIESHVQYEATRKLSELFSG